MHKMEKNSWFLNKNELNISLMRFHVNIKILKNSDFVFFIWTITDNERNKLSLNFNSLEDAISFTEMINDKRNINEVIELYNKIFENNEFVLDKPKIK